MIRSAVLSNPPVWKYALLLTVRTPFSQTLAIPLFSEKTMWFHAPFQAGPMAFDWLLVAVSIRSAAVAPASLRWISNPCEPPLSLLMARNQGLGSAAFAFIQKDTVTMPPVKERESAWGI